MPNICISSFNESLLLQSSAGNPRNGSLAYKYKIRRGGGIATVCGNARYCHYGDIHVCARARVGGRKLNFFL